MVRPAPSVDRMLLSVGRKLPMPLTPVDWNVVVLGRWNPAILTPQGIITRLFMQPAGTSFRVEVPIDTVGPSRVSYDGLVVVADFNQLMIEAPQNTYESLARAMAIAHRAVAHLPETPLRAAGYNVRFRATTDEEGLRTLRNATQHEWDSRFIDAGYPIAERGLSRRLEWEGGRILVSLSREQSGSMALLINFEHGGDRQALAEWLQTPVEDIRAQVQGICCKVLQLDPKDIL